MSDGWRNADYADREMAGCRTTDRISRRTLIRPTGPFVVEESVPRTQVPDCPVPKNREPGNHVKMKGNDVMSRERCLQEIDAQFSIIRDRLWGVCQGHSNGFYLHGPPGISKTHTVKNFLTDMTIPFEHVQGQLTGAALFDVIEENPDGVIVLDDVSAIFKEPKAVQILLAALGSPPDGSRVRKVSYHTARGKRVVYFTGVIVLISNLALDEHRNGVIAALKSRVAVQMLDPTPEQVEAKVFKIAMEGPAGVAAEDAVMVAEFLVRECRKRGTRLTIRLFVDSALPDFRMWKAGGTENHWEDLVRVTVAEKFVPQRHAVRDMPPGDQTDADRRSVPVVRSTFPTLEQRRRAWKEWNDAARRGSPTNHKNLKDSG